MGMTLCRFARGPWGWFVHLNNFNITGGGDIMRDISGRLVYNS